MTRTTRRSLLRRIPAMAAFPSLAASLGSFSTGVAAQASYPQRPVKLITNFPAGGPLDVLGRSLAEVMGRDLKQPFVVENKPGAAGNIGADFVAKTTPDGYSLLLTIDTTFTINPHLYPSMPFKPDDLKPLMVLSASGLLFGVPPTLGVKTLSDFVARSRGKTLNFASAGNGSPGHIAAELYADATGAKISHVPYKGNAPAVTALLAGEVDAAIIATPGLLPHVQAGKVQALAVTSHQRSPLLPQVPTVTELGMKDLEFEVLYLTMVPAGTPDAVTHTLQKAMTAALATPEVRSRIASLDLVALGETGPPAADRLKSMSTRYGSLVRKTGMKVD